MVLKCLTTLDQSVKKLKEQLAEYKGATAGKEGKTTYPTRPVKPKCDACERHAKGTCLRHHIEEIEKSLAAKKKLLAERGEAQPKCVKCMIVSVVLENIQ